MNLGYTTYLWNLLINQSLWSQVMFWLIQRGMVHWAHCTGREYQRATSVDSHVTILRPFEDYLSRDILRTSSVGRRMISSRWRLEQSGQTELPRALLNDYEISYEPSIEEQRRIVAKLDAAFEKIDQAIELTEENLLRAKSLFILRLEERRLRSWQVMNRTSSTILEKSRQYAGSNYKKQTQVRTISILWRIRHRGLRR